MGRAAELAIRLTAEAADAIAGADDTGDAYARMGDKVDKATKTAETGASRLDRAAGASDNLASKSSQATGGLGALASGLELVGLGPYAAGLQSAAMATDFFSGVGDIANLVLESQAVASARAKVSMVAHAVATRTSAVAQRLLNLAMAANPVLLIVAGVALLVAGFVLLYKKSDKFRAVVNGAMAVARAGIDKVKAAFAAIGPVVSKVFSFIGKIATTYVKVYVTAFTLVWKAAKAAFGIIRDVVAEIVGKLIDKAGNIRDKFSDAFNAVKRIGKAAFDAITGPVRDLIDLVDSLLDKIKSIHLPHIPGLGSILGKAGLGSSGSSSLRSSGSTSTAGAPVISNTFSITLTGTASPSDADAFMVAIDRRLRSKSLPTVFGT